MLLAHLRVTFCPTGHLTDEVDGISRCSGCDAALPMVMARVSELGSTGHESREELDNNKAFFEKMEAVRIKAGALMGMGDCRQSVTPKFGLFAPHDETGHIITRYFMPWNTHPTMAVTGSQCMAFQCAYTWHSGL